MTDAAEEGQRAVTALVSAFGSNDVDRYLARPPEDATSLFHTTDRLLTSWEEYRQEWASWSGTTSPRCSGTPPP